MAGGKSSAFDNDWLKLIFQAAPIANLADNAASAPLSNLYVSLHTADPGLGGAQNTNEATYGGYARVPVPRNSSGWVVTANSASPAAVIIFPTATAGSETETFFAVGTALTGTGKILYRGPVTANIVVTGGVAPELTTATAITES